MTVRPSSQVLPPLLPCDPSSSRRTVVVEGDGGWCSRSVASRIGGDGGASFVGDGRSQHQSGEQGASPGSDAEKGKKRRKWNGYNIQEATPVGRKRQMTAGKKKRLTACLETAGAWGWAASSDGGGRKRWSEMGKGKDWNGTWHEDVGCGLQWAGNCQASGWTGWSGWAGCTRCNTLDRVWTMLCGLCCVDCADWAVKWVHAQKPRPEMEAKPKPSSQPSQAKRLARDSRKAPSGAALFEDGRLRCKCELGGI